VVYHSGVLITNEIHHYEFVGIKETFLLNKFPTLENVVGWVREGLGWVDLGVENEVRLEG
jgi:hypothetical protein